jgi:O-antigen ligase
MTIAARATLAAAILAAVLAGALQALVAARVGLAGAVALPVAIAVAAAVVDRPIRGAQLAVLAIPFGSFSVASLSPTELLLLLTAAVALSRWALESRGPAVPGPLRALLALCLAVTLSAAVAADVGIVVRILLMWLAIAVVGILVAQASGDELWGVVGCIAIAGGVAGAMAIGGGTAQTLSAGGNLATNRAQGGFSQPNVLGFFLVMAVPAALVRSARGRPLVRIAFLVVAAVAFWALLLTLSRTSLVGAAIGMLVLLSWPPFRRVATVGLAVLAIFSVVNLHAIESSHEVSVVSARLATLGTSRTVGDDPRSRIWSATLQMIADHPVLGVGEGNFPQASLAYPVGGLELGAFDHAHDVPLTIAAEVGIPGILALGWLVVTLARLVGRALRRRGDPQLDLLAVGAAAALTGMIVPSLGDYPPRTNEVMAALVVLIAVLAGADRLRRSHPST